MSTSYMKVDTKFDLKIEMSAGNLTFASNFISHWTVPKVGYEVEKKSFAVFKVTLEM